MVQFLGRPPPAPARTNVNRRHSRHNKAETLMVNFEARVCLFWALDDRSRNFKSPSPPPETEQGASKGVQNFVNNALKLSPLFCYNYAYNVFSKRSAECNNNYLDDSLWHDSALPGGRLKTGPRCERG